MADAASPSATVDKIAEAKQKRKPKSAQNKARQPFFYELSRLMVVTSSATKGLFYKAQTKPNGPWPAGFGWVTIDKAHTYSVMTAGTTGDGRIAIVAQRSPQAELFFIVEKPDTVGPEEWSAPVSLGMPASTPAFVSLAMATDVDGRVEVFGTSSNNQQIWWKYQNPNRIVQKQVTITPPGTKTPITVTVNEIEPPATPWSDWMQMPGGLTQITALRNADGRIILFGLNAQNHLYRSEQNVAQALQPSDWSVWTPMDDPYVGTFTAMAPALDSAGAVNFFGINNWGQVLHTRQSPPCSATWTGWSNPGFISSGQATVLAAGTDGDDHLVLVACDSKVYNMNAQFDVEMQQWSGWMPFLRASAPTHLALDYNSDGRLTLFSYLATNGGTLYCTSQMAYSSTEWQVEWTKLGDSIHQFVVVRDPTPPASASQ